MNLFLYSNREKYLYAFAVCRRNISPLLLQDGAGRVPANASDFALCDNLRTDDFLQHELSAVKYHFFLGIVSVWWLLQPSTPPTPHKSTYSNLMRGLGSIVWFMYHHT